MRGRLRGIRERGGKVVVIDPRRTRTAEEADEHHFIRPGTDALLLAALAARSSRRTWPTPGALAEHVDGLDEVRGARARVHARARWRAPAASTAERDPAHGARAGRAPTRRRATAGSAPAPRSSARSRAGWSTCSTCSPATSTARAARCSRAPRRADEHLRRGRAAARACASGAGTAACAGSPRSSASCPWPASPRRSRRPARARCARSSPSPATPSSHAERRPARARRSRVSTSWSRVDIYVNETTRHADVILPAPAPLEKSHYDLALYQLAVRNVANYSPPVFERHRSRPSGRRSCGSPASSRARGRAPTSTRSTTS